MLGKAIPRILDFKITRETMYIIMYSSIKRHKAVNETSEAPSSIDKLMTKPASKAAIKIFTNSLFQTSTSVNFLTNDNIAKYWIIYEIRVATAAAPICMKNFKNITFSDTLITAIIMFIKNNGLVFS